MQSVLENHLSSMLMAVLFLVILAELLIPGHSERERNLIRMLSNIALGVMNQWGLRALLPAFLIVSIEDFGPDSTGLMQWLDWPHWIETSLSILLLDLYAYWVHRVFHQSRLLWRLHRVHHTDDALDFTSEYRHHPFEALVQLLLYVPVYLLLAPGVVAFLLHVLLQRSVSLIAHADVRYPLGWNRYLNKLFVTPAYHRLHHSADQHQTDSNYSIVFAFWDALFGSQNQVAHENVSIQTGLREFAQEQDQRIDRMLWQPFK